MVNRMSSTPLSFVQKFIVLPSLAGGIIGSPYFGYKEFMETKNKDYIDNLMHTSMGLMGGFYVGAALGLFWPITSGVFIGRYICREKKE
jgi:hypothetical protein